VSGFRPSVVSGFSLTAIMSKRSIAPMVNGRIRLRLLEESDLPMTLAWRNQDHIRKWFFSPDVISPEQHRAWFELHKDRDDDFVFVIEETETLNRPVGQVSLYHVDWAAGRAEFGRLMIGDGDARGLGLAKLATAFLVDEALTAWGLREVYLESLASNAPALAVYDACGFRQAGQLGKILRMTTSGHNRLLKSHQPEP
jgi:UDP-4-amino-4,6-dideoxy-N-acetyl-beta-L-altrosamine N-acetyltransferase